MKLKKILMVCSLMMLGACSEIGTASIENPGFKVLRPTQSDIDAISDGFAADVLYNNDLGCRHGYWSICKGL